MTTLDSNLLKSSNSSKGRFRSPLGDFSLPMRILQSAQLLAYLHAFHRTSSRFRWITASTLILLVWIL
jgi:hypothetical protein